MRPPPVTRCPYCAMQCGMTVRPGAARPAEADPASAANLGRLCAKGATSAALLDRPERLLEPMVRDGAGRLRRAGWDAALDELAARLAATRDAHGPASVGVFGSGALTNEKAYMLGKFARLALGTPHVDYNGRFCMAAAAAAGNRAFGLDRGLPFPVSDIAEAATLVLWGFNGDDTMPPLMGWVDRQQARGGNLVVVDPRRSATAARAGIHVQPVPGTDLAVANGLLHLVVEGGLADAAYIARRTVGFDDARREVLEWTPERVERVAGVPAAQLRAVVAALAGPGPVMVLTGRGPEQQTRGTDTVGACINLVLALGQVGRRGGGYGCVTGQGNGQGGREHGQKADQLPGYRLISDPSDRATVAAAWGVPEARLPGPGMPAVAMLDAAGRPDGIRALLVAGSNLAVAAPDAAGVRRRLAGLDCLAVLDAFPNDTTELAGFVLPVTQWAEEDGTTTSLEGRVQRRRRVVDPPATVRSDLWVLARLAERLGCAELFGSDQPAEVFAEMARVSAGGRADYSGITWSGLDAGGGVHWPCPAPGHPGTPRLFTDRFHHPDGRARFVPTRYRDPGEEPDGDFPIHLVTGRYREHYNSGAQTRRVPQLTASRPFPRLEMHPRLARRLGVAPGERVTVESRRGKVTLAAEVDAAIRPDTVFAAFHWGGTDALNVLTNPATDPACGMPEFKMCAVRVSAVPAGERR